MSADLDVRPESDEGSRSTGTHGRNRLTWLVAAAAAAVIAAVGGFAISGLGGDDKDPPQAGPQPLGDRGRRQCAGLAGQTTALGVGAAAGQVRGRDARDPGAVPPGLPGHGHRRSRVTR